jgi:hypothetical protein
MDRDDTEVSMGLATRSASSRPSRAQAGQAEQGSHPPGRDQALSRDQAEAAFLHAVRGGDLAARLSQVRAVEDAELFRLTCRLQRLRSECGCKVGAWTMTAALIAAPVVAVIHGASGPVGVLLLVLLSAVSVIGAAVAGKVLTIVVYRLRWRIECNQVLRHLAERGTDRDVILR